MKQIDHDPNEFTDKSAGWWSTIAILALLWVGYLYFHAPNWLAIALGLGTGCLLTAWAMDMTGGKVPASWRRKPPRP